MVNVREVTASSSNVIDLTNQHFAYITTPLLRFVILNPQHS